MTPSHRTRIVILGAGFAGVGVAQELTRSVPPDEACDIVIVDQNNFSLFTPMLTEVAGGEVDSSDIVAAIRSLSARITFEQGRVDTIDSASKSVTISIGNQVSGASPAQRTIHADHLVIALGSVTNFHHIDGLEEHSLTIKSVEQAEAIRNRAIALLERADEESDPHTRRALLTIVVGGGGFSGVETTAALNGMLRDLVGAYANIDPTDIRTLLVHPGARLLPEINEGLAEYAQTKLENRGVEVMRKTMVSGAGAGYVEVKPHSNGSADQPSRRIEAATLVWTGGVKPSPTIESAGLKLGPHHGIVVDVYCAVPNHPGIWALGDCAEVPRASDNGAKTYAPTAQNASREGKRVARNIAATMHGLAPEPFNYHPIGELAIVGKRSGVASLYGMRFSGMLAWAMWRAVYLGKLPRMSKRLRVALDWLLDAVSGRDIAAVPGERAQTKHHH